MAAPSEDLLHRARAALRLGPESGLRGLRRSHLGDGRCVAWGEELPRHVRVAVDAEVEREVPPALARRFGLHDFWGRWTRLECVAKLTGTPVALLHRAGGLRPPSVAGLELVTLTLDGVVVSVGSLGDQRLPLAHQDTTERTRT